MEDKQARDARFVEVIRVNRASMFRVARAMLRSDADAEDAVADATASAYAHIAALRSWEAVRPWLMRITVNACNKALRRRKREQPTDDHMFSSIPAQEAASDDIWAYVERLDAKYSVPLTLFYGEDMPLEGVARALHLPRGTVSSRLTRGRQALKRMMEKEGVLDE